MAVLYHASPVPNLTELTPHISNHGRPLVYLSDRRESVLVYLSNPVERHCKRTGFPHEGPFYKFASYGFSPEGKPVLEEYYPDAFADTFAGVSGWIYRAECAGCPPFPASRGPLSAKRRSRSPARNLSRTLMRRSCARNRKGLSSCGGTGSTPRGSCAGSR